MIALAAAVAAAFVTIPTDELRASYDTIWAVSDVHGRLDALEQLLRAAQLATARGFTRERQLLVVVGDSIDDGPDSVGVVLRLRDLAQQAAANRSRVVVLLGNHEVDFLANPRSARRELIASAGRAGLSLPRKHAGDRLAGSEFGQYLRSMPVAAFVGSWLFAHAGYVDSPDYFSRVDASWSRDDRYLLLRDPASIVGYHDWWGARRRRSAVKSSLAALGLDGLVFGHDPDAFGAVGTIAVQEGWLTKLDSGLKAGSSRGMLLRCDVQTIARGCRLAMNDGGKPTCRALTPDGALHDLPVR